MTPRPSGSFDPRQHPSRAGERAAGGDVLEGLAALTRRQDPHFAHGMGHGRPQAPREYRRGPAWLLLAIAVALFTVGVLTSHGLLIATGLVAGGAAGNLFDPQRHRYGRYAHGRRHGD
ncbi:DUF3040 domain-containing protein [Streptomyces sp. 796.1]|uniref:DUF3040 domain-containing protein n=1 Tax=Streptomyces sp. 796.1 TaxID=3163029 RepID=UPI0039C947E6